MRQLTRNGRTVWLLVFMVLTTWSAFSIDWSDLTNDGGATALRSILKAFLTPDLSAELLKKVLQASWTTISYAATSMSVAIFLGLSLGLIASGTLFPHGKLGLLILISTRAFLGATRSIHELVWALLLVVAIGLSPTAGILAIALPYSGTIGRIFAEQLQDVPDNQLKAMRSSGANNGQALLLARIPSVLPDTVSYLFYRFECAIRTASVLSFVGLGGIGFQIHIALSDLKFESVATLLYTLIALILFVELTSNSVRKRLLS